MQRNERGYAQFTRVIIVGKWGSGRCLIQFGNTSVKDVKYTQKERREGEKEWQSAAMVIFSGSQTMHIIYENIHFQGTQWLAYSCVNHTDFRCSLHSHSIATLFVKPEIWLSPNLHSSLFFKPNAIKVGWKSRPWELAC